MKDSTDAKLREYVSDRVRREIAERLGAGSDIPEAHRRVIVEDGIRAGADHPYPARHPREQRPRPHRYRSSDQVP
jgi:hypothetical protein